VHRIGAMVEEIEKVGSLDRASHGMWYEVVAKAAEKAACESS
jgi:hypothetical protein